MVNVLVYRTDLCRPSRNRNKLLGSICAPSSSIESYRETLGSPRPSLDSFVDMVIFTVHKGSNTTTSSIRI